MTGSNSSVPKDTPIRSKRAKNASMYPNHTWIKNINKSSYVFLGFFWIGIGAFLLLNSYFRLPDLVNGIILIFSSIYLLSLSILRIIPKIYYVLGLVIMSVPVGIVASSYGGVAYFPPSMLGIVSIGIVFYGIIFRRGNSIKHIKYIVSGAIMFGMVLFIFGLTLNGKGFFLTLIKGWPILIILFGVYQIYIKKHFEELDFETETKTSKEED